MSDELKKSIRLRRIAVVAWVSFVLAAIATMIFFAMIDPLVLGQVTTWSVDLTRIEGYSIGFILFWILTAASSSISIFLLSSNSSKKD